MDKVRFACPRCQTIMQTGVERVGYDVACPHCSHRFRLVESGGDPIASDLTPTLPPSSNRQTLSPPAAADSAQSVSNPHVAPVIDRQRSTAKQARFVCPYCQSTSPPKWKSEVSQIGWIVFAILLVTTCIFSFVGLFIRDHYRVCSQCKIRLE